MFYREKCKILERENRKLKRQLAMFERDRESLTKKMQAYDAANAELSEILNETKAVNKALKDEYNTIRKAISGSISELLNSSERIVEEYKNLK